MITMLLVVGLTSFLIGLVAGYMFWGMLIRELKEENRLLAAAFFSADLPERTDASL